MQLQINPQEASMSTYSKQGKDVGTSCDSHAHYCLEAARDIDS